MLIVESLFHGSRPNFSLPASVPELLFDQPVQVRSNRRLIEPLNDFV
jgi:hypothetical protein